VEIATIKPNNGCYISLTRHTRMIYVYKKYVQPTFVISFDAWKGEVRVGPRGVSKTRAGESPSVAFDVELEGDDR